VEVRRGTYDVVVDGKRAGSVELQRTFQMPVEPGRHTLQIRNGRNSSRTQTFDADEGQVVAFPGLRPHPPRCRNGQSRRPPGPRQPPPGSVRSWPGQTPPPLRDDARDTPMGSSRGRAGRHTPPSGHCGAGPPMPASIQVRCGYLLGSRGYLSDHDGETVHPCAVPIDQDPVLVGHAPGMYPGRHGYDAGAARRNEHRRRLARDSRARRR
jgi:hypothetical protein